VVPVEWIRGAEGDWGGYAALQVQTSRRLYLGFREDLMGTDLQHSGFASWYASEFLRIRGGGGYAPATRTATVLTQLTFVWGSHPVEPWWVNR
jgi:hypothetical protein